MDALVRVFDLGYDSILDILVQYQAVGWVGDRRSGQVQVSL
jgi:hypothetical protein